MCKSQAIDLLNTALNVLTLMESKMGDILETVIAARATEDIPTRVALYSDFSDQLDDIDNLCLNSKWQNSQMWPAPIAEGIETPNYAYYNENDAYGSPSRQRYIGTLYSGHGNLDNFGLTPLGEYDDGSVIYKNILLGMLTEADQEKFNEYRNTYIPFSPNIITIAFSQIDSNMLINSCPRNATFNNVRTVFPDFTTFSPNVILSPDFWIALAKNGAPVGTVNNRLEFLQYLIENDYESVLSEFPNLNLYTQMANYNTVLNIGTGVSRIRAQRAYINRYIEYLNQLVVEKFTDSKIFQVGRTCDIYLGDVEPNTAYVPANYVGVTGIIRHNISVPGLL